MKKLIKYIIPAALIMFMLSACEDNLELDPHQSVSFEEAFETYEMLDAAVTGAYDAIQDDGSYGQDYIQLNEILTSEIYWEGSFNSYTDVANKQILTDNAEAETFWIEGYDGINRANRILEVVENDHLSGPEYEANKDRIKGEALFIRALLHWQLVTFFAQPAGFTADNSHVGVPIMLKSSTTIEDAKAKPSRESVADVYAQIISDLQTATTLLPVQSEDRADKYAAYGFLSRVYLQKGENELAAAAAQEVINSNSFSLMNDVKYFINSNSDESVFEIQMTASDNLSNTNDALASYWWHRERDEIHIPQSVINRYEEDDKRLEGWFYNIPSIQGGDTTYTWYSNKYTDVERNVPCIRYSEVLLNAAEALVNHNGFDSDAINYVNIVRRRADVEEIDPANAEELMAAIKHERKLELVHEGIRVNDLRRWREPIGFSSPGLAGNTVEWNDPNMVFPIPQRERDVNENLSQNPGY